MGFPDTPTSYKLDELAAAAGVSARTVRYYVQRGLLPAPAFRGRDTAYDGEHLLRLQAIRRLQEQHLPLDAIQAELARAGRDELQALARGPGAIVRPVPPVPMPMPMPRPMPAERWRRWELAPGVELFASDRAGIDDELARELRDLIERHVAAGAKG